MRTTAGRWLIRGYAVEGNRTQYMLGSEKGYVMLFDILVALLITVIAVVLGLTVHPVLLFIIALALVYLVGRGRARRGVRSGTY